MQSVEAKKEKFFFFKMWMNVKAIMQDVIWDAPTHLDLTNVLVMKDSCYLLMDTPVQVN